MTQLASDRTMASAESRLITAVCAAHMMSHYYMLVLAPLLAFVRGDFNVSYTEVALALTVFNVVSGLLQTPVGFLVDRIGARIVLIAGLALSSAAFAIAGLFNSYWVFIAMYGVAGLGNTAYHPSDYSLLSHHSPPDKLSQVFAFHTFAGMLGSAIAPVTLLAMQNYFGWRGAYVGAGVLGFIVLAALIAQPEPIAEALQAASRKGKFSSPSAAAGWRLLMSPAILLNLAFFTLTALMGNGLNTYLVVALGALHATPTAIANVALTSLLAMNAIGVLAGGVLAGRVRQHALIAASGLTIGGVVTALIGFFDFAPAALIALMGLSGFSVGATYPSRDMLVRVVTPPGAYGRVFGFVSTGFNIGASIAPIVYGMLMDHGQPRGVFLLSAAVSLVCVSTVTFGFSRRET
jgi:MFS transporter, FSR family, fosmidomycin resistance protein